MKRRNYRLLLVYAVLFLFLPPLSLLAQEEEQLVLIYPIEAQVREEARSDSSLKSIAAAVEDTLAVTLRFMRGYEVEVAEDAGAVDPAGLAAVAERRSADNIIFGSIRMDGEAFVVELSVYDRYNDEVSEPKSERATSVFETFDMADRLVAELVEGFSGVRVAYGSIRFDISGADDPFLVLIDGKKAGDSPGSIEKLLIGEHELKVVQERPSGDAVLLERSLKVEEGEVYRIPLELPFLTESEREDFSSLDRQLVRSYSEQLALNAATLMLRGQSLSTARGLLERGASMGFDGYERLLEKYREWERLHELFIAGGDDEDILDDLSRPHLFARFSPAVEQDLLSFGLGSRDEELKMRHRESIDFLREHDRIYRFARKYSIPSVEIDFDGELEDWEGYEARAYEGEYQREVDELVDIEAVFMGLQGDYLLIGINQSPGSGMLTNSRITFSWGDDRLDIIIPLGVSRDGEVERDREARLWHRKRGGGREYIGRCEARITMDGYELRVPQEMLVEFILDRPLLLEVESKGTASSDTVEAVEVFIPSAGGRRAAVPASGKELTRGERRKRWLFPVQLGIIDMGEYDPGGLFGVHYAFSGRFFWGIDTLVLFTGPEGGAPPALPLPGLIISSDNQSHLFSLNYLPLPFFGDFGQFIGAGYGYRRFTVSAGLGLDDGGVFTHWFYFGYTF